MVLARWQATIVDDLGNVQNAASVEVRHETGGAPLAVIYSDRDGTTPISNPITTGSDGFAAFHVAGGTYKITATKGAFSREWRYVGIGTAAEFDAPSGIIGGTLGATENALLRAFGTGGLTAQGSGIIVDDDDNLAFPSGTVIRWVDYASSPIAIDVAITHSPGALAFTGATDGYSFDNDITQSFVGGLWTDAADFNPSPTTGVNITRLERLLVGAAADNDGTQLGTADWLSARVGFSTTNSEFAVIAAHGRAAITAAIRAIDNDQSPSNGIACSLYNFNDNSSFVQNSFGLYIESQRSSGAGFTTCMELDPVEFGTPVSIDPYSSSFAGVVSGIWLASGGEETTPNDVPVGFALINNNAKFQKGIYFHKDSISGADGTGGSNLGTAIALALGHKLDWYSEASTVSASLYSSAAGILRTDGGLRASAGIGYITGAGGAVTQATNKNTAVTLNKLSGQITMNGAALGAGGIAQFTVNNSAYVAATDTVEAHHASAGTAGAYIVNVMAAGANAFALRVTNSTGGSLSEAIVINFNIIKGSTS